MTEAAGISSVVGRFGFVGTGSLRTILTRRFSLQFRWSASLSWLSFLGNHAMNLKGELTSSDLGVPFEGSNASFGVSFPLP
ncbi:13864_t:CDS:2 [Dentiscutata erythropus]|uniref:13864_t:CDS:1 n=1 Tax=Dentiscutata erythropus TaxID=1348616 RepID=A0A9N9I721_9GLOM|nr:13864_t:CDS:2 [Dentiscutata erythropus]